MIKIRFISVLFLAAIAISTVLSCTKLASKINKDFTFSTSPQPFVIPIVPDSIVTAANLFKLPDAPPITFSYNLDSLIKANTDNILGVGNIGSLKVNSCVLTVTNPHPLSNFQDFETVTITFMATGSSYQYIITANQPDVYSETMTLSPADPSSDMKNILQGNNFKFLLSGKMRHGTADSMKCNAVFNFTVNVQG